MTFARRKPCPNCPFRKDAKLAYWHPEMYLMLQDIERTEGDVATGMKTFGCHQDRHGPPKAVEPCVGWLLNQRENGIPNLGLRLLLAMRPEAGKQFEECEPDGDMYETVTELVDENLAVDRVLNPYRYDADGEYIGDEEGS